MTLIIASANQKGGVGKTTTTTSIGHGLSQRGYKVLLVDLDPQGHVSKMLGFQKSPGVRRWYYDEEPIKSVIVEARKNLWILPADKTLDRVMGKVKEEFDGVAKFAEAMRRDTLFFDVALLDLAPSLNVIQVAALLSSDIVLIPTRLRSIDLDGVNEIVKSISEISRRGRTPSYFVLPTFYERNTRETQELLQEVVNIFGKRVLPPIVMDTRVSEAPGRGMTIWEYAPDCNGAIGYLNGGGKRIGGYQYTLDQMVSIIEGA